MVLNATQSYQEDNDVLAEFIDTECVIEKGLTIKARDLYTRYTEWAIREHFQKDDIITNTAFGRRMSEKSDKFKKEKRGGCNFYIGISMKESGGLGRLDIILGKTHIENNSIDSLSKTVLNPPVGTKTILNSPALPCKTISDMSFDEAKSIFQ